MGLCVLDCKSLPTPKQEQWRFTNLERALGEALINELPQTPDQVSIYKSRGQISDKAEDIVWIGEDGAHHQLRLKIVLEEGAQATVIERHSGEGVYWKNMGTEIVLGENSRLNHIRIQNDSIEAVHTDMVHITMNCNSCLNSFSMNMGAKLSRHDVHTVINGSGTECQLSGVNLLKGKQLGDSTILMEHIAPHSSSNQFYRSILGDQSHGVFQGKIHVHREAQKTDGYQLANTILLSQGSRMNTKPELEIYADDVKCSHGTTTGQLEEEPMFYMRSRGLSERQARMLLIQAFVDEAIDKISYVATRNHIKEIAKQWLKAQLNI